MRLRAPPIRPGDVTGKHAWEDCSMKTLAFVIPALLICGCAADDPYGTFVGTYKTTLVLSASGSQTYTDTLAISEGQTADLILSSQQLGSMKATIIGD
ncbi:MAG TPA: hypothetical protein VIU61_02265, partial [Kofleriaceae bacterium]